MTKTEELGEEIARLIFKHKYPNLEWERYINKMLEKQQCFKLATQILQTCQKAGLAFVVEDAEIPRAELPKYPIRSKAKAYQYGVEDQCRLQARAGWEKTEEIDTREPR